MKKQRWEWGGCQDFIKLPGNRRFWQILGGPARECMSNIFFSQKTEQASIDNFIHSCISEIIQQIIMEHLCLSVNKDYRQKWLNNINEHISLRIQVLLTCLQKGFLFLEIIHTEFLNVKHITLLIFLKKWFSDIIECLIWILNSITSACF